MLSSAVRSARKNNGVKWEPYAGSGCVLWLPGQDDAYSSTIRDRSGQGNHGTISGATWTRLSSGLWGLSLDGVDDRIDFSSVNGVLGATGTVLMWVKPGFAYDAAAPPDGEWRLLSLVDGSNNRIIDIYFDPTDDRFENYCDGPGTINSTTPAFSSGTPIFIAYTWDSSVEQALIVNSTRVADVGSWTANTPATLKLGCYRDNSDEWLGGIFLFRLFDNVLNTNVIEGIRQGERHLFGV